MATHTSQRIEYINIGDAVREIEQRFAVDPNYRDWKGKKEINIRCPKCTDKKYHLGLNFVKNAYNCYRCPFHGSLSSFLKQYGIKYETKTQVYQPEMVSTTAPKIKVPIDFARNEVIANKAKAYMITRGFDLAFLKKNFKLWPITNFHHYYFGYIIVELNSYAFYGRRFMDLTPAHQRHIIRKSDPQMKLYYTYEKNNSETILVVESMFNLMKAAQFGYNAICIFGKGNWGALVDYVKKRSPFDSYCLCFDKDVIMNDVDRFFKKIQKGCEIRESKWSYIDPVHMPCNDIADMDTAEMLHKTMMTRKSIDSLYLNMMSIGE